jgi:putative SOS response-associated peptidase YedK
VCGRFAFYSPHEAVVRLFGLSDDTPAIEPGYNIAPASFIATVRASSDPGDATRRLARLYWGLVPAWARDKSIGARLTNARAETLHEKPAFRQAYRKRRALVPADGYYEWMKMGSGPKQPYFIQPASGTPFGLAALWESWRDPASGEPLESVALVTTAAARNVAHIHDRMPVIVPREAYAEWLGPSNQDVGRLGSLLEAAAAQQLVARPVSRLVSNARNQGPALIEPVDADATPLPAAERPPATEDLFGAIDPGRADDEQH